MKTLFIGNSYTYCNDLPGMLQKLSQACGRMIETEKVTSGGKTLQWHWYNPSTLDTIADGRWDFVILQDHSLSAVEEPEKLARAAARFADRARGIGATPVLYVTWARQHMPEMQSVITDTYARVGGEIGAKLAPVGPAWRIALNDIPKLTLHVEDRSHPNILGTYLAACVFFATLFDESPIGLSNKLASSTHVKMVIDRDIANALQSAAWQSIHEARP